MRVIAALVLAPIAIAVAWAGGWLWAGLVTLAAIGLYVEWLMIVGVRPQRRVIATGRLRCRCPDFAWRSGRIDAALVTVALGVVSVAFSVRASARGSRRVFAMLPRRWLRRCWCALDQVCGIRRAGPGSAGGLGTDIGGYFAGRGIGGPKLWPRVSPKKTWAGAIGGFIASLAVAAGFAGLGFRQMGPLLLLGAALSIASQLGDLFESAVKRRFGVKDSSQIIPGHGGLLDRLDGFVAAIVLAALIGILRGGVDGVGRGLMVW